MTKGVRTGHARTFYQRFVTDPLTGIVVFLLWTVFKVLPVDAASAFGAGLGSLMGPFFRAKNKTALHNLRKCLPELTEKEHRRIIRQMWRHFGRMVGELPHSTRMMSRVKVTGVQYLKQAREDQKAGFFCSAHLGNWELCGAITQMHGFPLHLVYRAANNPWIEKTIYQKRQNTGVVLIPKGGDGAKTMIELLKKGEHIGMLCDQKMREGIDVPFFGYPAKTAPAIATLALKYNLPIYPARVIREKGAHYHVIVYPPLEMPQTADKNEATLQIMTQINSLLEEWIRAKPEQWLWIHHRWPKSEYKD